jgi:hypothetical protein
LRKGPAPRTLAGTVTMPKGRARTLAAPPGRCRRRRRESRKAPGIVTARVQ